MNAFEELAEQQTPRAVKKRQPRPEALIEKDKEKSVLSKAYEKQWQEKLEAQLKGPSGTDLERLITFLGDLSIDAPDELVNFVEQSPLLKADEETRYTALRLIDWAIIHLRLRHGMTPIADALPGEDLTVFEICKKALFP